MNKKPIDDSEDTFFDPEEVSTKCKECNCVIDQSAYRCICKCHKRNQTPQEKDLQSTEKNNTELELTLDDIEEVMPILDDTQLTDLQSIEKCKQIGELSRINEIKSFTCLELPIRYIHKPVGEWMCTVCAKNLLARISR